MFLFFLLFLFITYMVHMTEEKVPVLLQKVSWTVNVQQCTIEK